MGKTSKILNAGHIVIVNLDPTIGDEKQKTRMYVVLEPGGSPLELIIVLPITEHHSSRSQYFFVPVLNYREVGLVKPSAIDCYQIRTFSIKRLKKNEKGNPIILGTVNQATLHEIRKRLSLILDITEEHVS